MPHARGREGTVADHLGRGHDTVARHHPARPARDRRAQADAGWRLPPPSGGAERQLVGIVSRGDFRGLEQARLDEETGYWEIL
jgi:hypothetical protein